MGCSKPDLRENLDKGMERQSKILKLMDQWYKQATQATPPPATDPSVLSYNSLCTYYYTKDTQNKNNIQSLVTQGLNAAIQGLTGVTIDSSSIEGVVSSALANTTKNETSQGFSTCVLKSFEGTFNDTKCLYKPMVVAVSFNFSSSEYNTSENVAAFGYWVYLLCTERPLGDASAEDLVDGEADENGLLQFNSIHGEKLKYKVPKDMSIVGKKYKTLHQLDDS